MKLSYAQWNALSKINENKLFAGKRVSTATISALTEKGMIEFREVSVGEFIGGGYFLTEKGEAHI